MGFEHRLKSTFGLGDGEALLSSAQLRRAGFAAAQQQCCFCLSSAIALPMPAVHSYEDGQVYIFQEFLCIDEVGPRCRIFIGVEFCVPAGFVQRATASNGNKPKRLRIPYSGISKLKKVGSLSIRAACSRTDCSQRNFLKIVTSGSLSIYFTASKIALKLEGFFDRNGECSLFCMASR
jgi:hypothetical protein